MVPMRDGVRLAADMYRPAGDGERSRAVPDDPLPDAVRQDRQALRRDRRLLCAAGLRRCRAGPARPVQVGGQGRVLPRRQPAGWQGRLRHDRVDRGAALVERQRRDGRLLVRGDDAGPPRWKARRTWPRSGPTSCRPTATTTRSARAARCSCICSGRCSCTPSDAQELAGRPAKLAFDWEVCATCATRLGDAVPARADPTAHVPRSKRRSSTTTPVEPTTTSGRARTTTSRAYFDRHADVPGRSPAAGTTPCRRRGDISRRWRRRTDSPEADHRPVDARDDARRPTWAADVDFGAGSSLGYHGYNDVQLRSSTACCWRTPKRLLEERRR